MIDIWITYYAPKFLIIILTIEMVCACCLAIPFLFFFGIIQFFKDVIIEYLSIESLLKRFQKDESQKQPEKNEETAMNENKQIKSKSS